jgi:D-lactate dehydrogenase (cytochrome)
MYAVNKYGCSGRKWPEKDSLFFKFQGHSQAALQDTAKVVKTIVEKHGGTGFELARNEEDAEALWKDRRNAYSAGLAFVKGSRGTPTDVW